MVSLVYNSTASKSFNKESLELLLAQARSRNAIYGITGMMLYDYGAFLQVLEGNKVDVEEIFASIFRDPRHMSIKVLTRQDIQMREFSSWSMAYSDISGVVALPEGHQIGSLKRLNASSAQQYLRFFRPKSNSAPSQTTR